MNATLDNYTRYAVALDELRYARKLLSEVCFVADRPLCEAAVRKENIVINIPDFGNDVESFEEFWSQVPDLFNLSQVQ